MNPLINDDIPPTKQSTTKGVYFSGIYCKCHTFVPHLSDINILIHARGISALAAMKFGGPSNWDDTGRWNSSVWKTRTLLPYIINTTAVDILAKQGAKASKELVLTLSETEINFLHSGRQPTGAKRPSAGCPECICNRPRPWSRPCVSDWGCGTVILLSRGEFGREKNKICYQRVCVWTFCYMPNL